MPIYAYRCSACGFEKDFLQKMSDAPLTVCPNCGQPALQKQVTAAGFQLKGSGWYVTDFRNKDGGGKGRSPAADVGKSGDGAAGSGSAEGTKAAEPGASAADVPKGDSPASPAPAPSGGSSSKD